MEFEFDAKAALLAFMQHARKRSVSADDAAQATLSRRLLERYDAFVPLTVLLEVEWVLRSVFNFAAAEPRDGRHCPRLDPGWAGLAGALRLAAARPHDGFVSFDRLLAPAARRDGAPSVRKP
jgi:hypothetical protein